MRNTYGRDFAGQIYTLDVLVDLQEDLTQRLAIYLNIDTFEFTLVV